MIVVPVGGTMWPRGSQKSTGMDQRVVDRWALPVFGQFDQHVARDRDNERQDEHDERAGMTL